MHLILCLDSRDGMAFNGRRLSRDKIQREKMLGTVGDEKLILRPSSAALFENLPPNVQVTESAEIADGAYFFAECAADLPSPSSVERLVIYRWGRNYPADEYAPVSDYIQGKKLLVKSEFAGSSHPEMTEEVYA